MSTLGTGKQQGRTTEESNPRLNQNLYLLVTKELHASPPMNPLAPVMPEERPTPHSEWVQENTHLARFARFVTIPLTLRTFRARATAADAGGVHDAQAAVGFSALLLDMKHLICGAAKGSVWLEREIAT